MPQKYYIGLAISFHDPALAIVDAAGEIVFAEGTERYMQDKRAFNCVPDHLIRMPKLIKQYCGSEAELVIAITWSRNYIDRNSALAGASSFLANFDLDPLSTKNTEMWPWFHTAGTFQQAMMGTMRQAANNLTGHSRIHNPKTIRYYDHHLTHAATACFMSPFAEGACAIVDGMGETRSFDFFSYKHGKIKSILQPWTGTRLDGPSGSLGHFYAVLCGLCGFDPIKGEEWKVMGLAPYGRFDKVLYQRLGSIISVRNLEIVYDNRRYADWLAQMKRLMRPAGSSPLAAADLAYNGQRVFEDIMLQLLNNFYGRGLSKNLILGGGCALNSTCNGLITAETGFDRMFIPAAPGDDGNALGAALLACYEDNPQVKPRLSVTSPYLGSGFSQETIDNFLRFSNHQQVQHLPGEVHQHAARLLADGKIIGWLQGRAEFGPRALGNRSILADPRRDDMKDEINARVKFREEFRPFAPSILHEYGPAYFENYQETPYMERTLRFKPEVRDKVPAVVHANETGRLQSVKKEWSEKYYNLISAFHELTGVPIVLNTSYNVMGKPIVHSVEDALSVFYTTGLDALVIEDYLIEK